MVQVKKLNILVLASIFAAVGVLFGLQQIFAATGSLYISPGSASVQTGSNITVAVRINPGTGVDGVEASLSYDGSKREFVGIDAGGSAVGVALGAETGGGGAVINKLIVELGAGS